MNRDDLRIAAGLPRVPFMAGLVAGMSMAGFRIVPEDLWDVIAEKAAKVDFWDSKACVEGFTIERNHTRSEMHESWQGLTLPERYEPGTWYVPVDELLELKFGPNYCDFVSIVRLMCTGDESDLRAAVENLMKMEEAE